MNEKDMQAQQVVTHMMEHDKFSQWLGITVLEIKKVIAKYGCR